MASTDHLGLSSVERAEAVESGGENPQGHRMSLDLHRWLAEASGPDWIWYAKYLAANDTLATGSHQVGPYFPRLAFDAFFPSIRARRTLNPRHEFPVVIASEGLSRVVAAIWYNNAVVGDGTRNESRITGWGGAASPILDPESTGSLCIFAGRFGVDGDVVECRVWICRDPLEEQVALDWLGAVEPGAGILVSPTGRMVGQLSLLAVDAPCVMSSADLPAAWRESFPEASEIVERSIRNLESAVRKPVDERLLARRECEYRLFLSIEAAHVLPRAQAGFESIDEFVSYANAITNRRKSRSGRSLELQVRAVLNEEKVPHDYNVESENGKRPDFLFPSVTRYQDSTYPESKLRMLAVKTTVKDRWRQVADEAGRIGVKHLLTLQEGVSEGQYSQMRELHIRLVVPRALHSSYPQSIRGELLTIDQFIVETRAICAIPS